MPTAFEEPRHAGAVARFQGGDARTNLLYNAHAFMAQNHAGFIAKSPFFTCRSVWHTPQHSIFNNAFHVAGDAVFFRHINLMIVVTTAAFMFTP